MRAPLISLLFITVVLVSSTLATTTPRITNSGYVIGPSSGRWFDYVVIIMMENHNINNTYDNGSHNCFGNCTYYTSFANSNGLAEEFTVDSIKSESSGTYIAITSGYGDTPQSCNNGVFPTSSTGCRVLQIPNIVDRLESAGIRWKAYMEDYPTLAGCDNDWSGTYHPNHNPFIYYADIQNSAARCSDIVRANSLSATQNATGCWPTALPTDDVLFNDLNSPSTAPKYMFLTPNSIDDNHDCDDVAVGNAWMNLVIPQILESQLFRTQRAAMFITFDEPGCTGTCPFPNTRELYTVWASNSANPITKLRFKSVNPYTFYNPLRAIEYNWNLQPLNSTTDGAANNMSEYFR